ncbi:MAG: hypothetical protein KKF48_02590 [Nanoarchaeota archaeon]|nr:hypothetical protein [Nanoarchaeota archaeon]MBU1027909.1 hypothetical protein [Nanoarchaeota archaeon]
MKRRNKKISYSSILIGILTFGLLGFSMYNGLGRLGLIEYGSIMYIFLSFGAILGAFLGYSKPLGTELISFAITGLIMVQATWDTIYDIQTGFSEPRVLAGIIALGIFLINTFTGRFKRGTAKKQTRRLLGLR